MKSLLADRHGVVAAIVVAIIVVVVVLALIAVALVPFRTIPVNETHQAALASGVDALVVDFTLTGGKVDINFVDNSTVAASLSVVGNGRSGLMGPEQPVNVTWSEGTSGNILTVTSSVTIRSGWELFSSSDLTCILTLSDQLRSTINITSTAGAVVLNTTNGTVLDAMHIQSTAGGVKVNLANNTTLAGPLELSTTAGGVELDWNNVQVDGNVSVGISTTAGGAKVAFVQSAPMGGNVTVNASTTVGGTEADMELAGSTAAKVDSHTGLGGITVHDRAGFNGTDAELTSENYPGTSNFQLLLDTNTGGINLNLRYTS